MELQVACDDHSTLARWVTDPHCPRRPALGPSRYSACHQRQSRNARKARSRRRGPSLTERFRRPRRRCRTNDQVVAKAQPLANRCRDAHLANRRCAAARGARPAFVLAGHEGHDVVAACVRERQRSTAALASTSWLLRSLSGDGVDGERVIATVALRSSRSGDLRCFASRHETASRRDRARRWAGSASGRSSPTKGLWGRLPYGTMKSVLPGLFALAMTASGRPSVRAKACVGRPEKKVDNPTSFG